MRWVLADNVLIPDSVNLLLWASVSLAAVTIYVLASAVQVFMNHTRVIDRPEGANRLAHLCKCFGIRFPRNGWHIFASDRVIPLTIVGNRVRARAYRLSVGFVDVTLHPGKL